MSYLDKPLTRESYFDHISTKSKSHKTNIKIALDWFDKFCIGQFDGKNEQTILRDSLKQKYDEPQKHSKNLYSLLQDFVNYLGIEGQDPSTIRCNFNLVKGFLNWYGFEIYSESVKSRLNFPTKIEEEAYPLTLENIKTILSEANARRRVLYLFLSSTGMRIQETLKLRKRDLDFDFDRVMVKIPGKYTKTRKPRKTFISNETLSYLKPILATKKDDDLIFATNEDSLKAKHTEEDYFYRLRVKVGLIERYDNGIHKITLHSFRSWFITKGNRVDSDFGNALGGHAKYMKRYNRFTDQELCELFIKAEPSLSIFENVDSNENLKKIQELQGKLEELEGEKRRNVELRTDLDDLKLRVELLTTSKEQA
jgi:integrase